MLRNAENRLTAAIQLLNSSENAAFMQAGAVYSSTNPELDYGLWGNDGSVRETNLYDEIRTFLTLVRAYCRHCLHSLDRFTSKVSY